MAIRKLWLHPRPRTICGRGRWNGTWAFMSFCWTSDMADWRLSRELDFHRPRVGPSAPPAAGPGEGRVEQGVKRLIKDKKGKAWFLEKAGDRCSIDTTVLLQGKWTKLLLESKCTLKNKKNKSYFTHLLSWLMYVLSHLQKTKWLPISKGLSINEINKPFIHHVCNSKLKILRGETERSCMWTTYCHALSSPVLFAAPSPQHRCHAAATASAQNTTKQCPPNRVYRHIYLVGFQTKPSYFYLCSWQFKGRPF